MFDYVGSIFIYCFFGDFVCLIYYFRFYVGLEMYVCFVLLDVERLVLFICVFDEVDGGG